MIAARPGPILFVAMTTTFRIGVTRDFLKADGTLGFGDIGLDLLDEAPTVEWEFLAENTTELRPRPDPRLRRPAGSRLDS